MENRTRKLISFLVVIFLLQVIAGGVVLADNPKVPPMKFAGVGVSPGVIELTGKVGETLTGEVDVLNDSDKPMSLKIEIKDFVMENNRIKFLDEPLQNKPELFAPALFFW